MQFAVAVIVSLWLAVYRCWAVMAVGCGLWGLVGLGAVWGCPFCVASLACSVMWLLTYSITYCIDSLITLSLGCRYMPLFSYSLYHAVSYILYINSI